MEHKIIRREKEWVDNDTIGYIAECSCGEIMTDWFIEKCEERVQNHLANKMVSSMDRIKELEKENESLKKNEFIYLLNLKLKESKIKDLNHKLDKAVDLIESFTQNTNKHINFIFEYFKEGIPKDCKPAIREFLK